MKPALRYGLIGALLVGVAATAFTFGTGTHAATAPADATAPVVALTVTAVEATEREWPQLLRASGRLEAWQESVIGAETGSLRITDVLVDVGAQVTKGQELARLYQDGIRADLMKQEAAVAKAKVAYEQAVRNAKRVQAVKSGGALSDQTINEYVLAEETARANLASAQADLETTRIKLDQTTIRAVDDGVISSRTATPGTVVAAGTEMFRLVRQGRVEWCAEIDAQQLPLVREGQTVNLELPGTVKIEGTVRAIAPTVNATTNRGIVYASLPSNPEARIGAFATGSIALGAKPALTLPQGAIVMRDGRSYVFTISSDNRVVRKSVVLGRHNDDRVEVLDGIGAKDRIVERGAAFLSDGALVSLATSERAS